MEGKDSGGKNVQIEMAIELSRVNAEMAGDALVLPTIQSDANYHGRNGRHKTKSVWITGASRGLGKAIAEECASRGYGTILIARTQPALDEIAKKLSIKAPSYVLPLDLEIRNEEDWDRTRESLETAVKTFGAPDVLINNAGEGLAEDAMNTTFSEFKRMHDLNCFGAVVCANTLLHYMQVRGGQIININSIAGEVRPQEHAAYSMSKAALSAFSETLRKDMRSYGIGNIRVTDVFPTLIQDTNFFESKGYEAYLYLVKRYGISVEKAARQITNLIGKKAGKKVYVPAGGRIVAGIHTVSSEASDFVRKIFS